MRILVMGAGSIGSFLGARLVEAGHELTLVGRHSFRESVSTHGLVVEEQDHTIRVSDVAVVDSPEHIRVLPDLILCTVKVHDTVSALESLRFLLTSETAVILMQNGVGGDELAITVLPDNDILAGTVTLAVDSLSPGRFRVTTTSGGLGIASVRPNANTAPYLALFRRAGFKVDAYDDYRAMRWSKLLLNILGNATPAILDWPLQRVFEERGIAELEVAAFKEAVAIMNALRLRPVGLPGYPVPLFAKVLCSIPEVLARKLLQQFIVRGRGGKMPSLHMDLERGRNRSEVEYLNGAVVRAASQLDLRVPANERIYSVLSKIVGGTLDWNEYRNPPDRLLEGLELVSPC